MFLFPIIYCILVESTAEQPSNCKSLQSDQPLKNPLPPSQQHEWVLFKISLYICLIFMISLKCLYIYLSLGNIINIRKVSKLCLKESTMVRINLCLLGEMAPLGRGRSLCLMGRGLSIGASCTCVMLGWRWINWSGIYPQSWWRKSWV